MAIVFAFIVIGLIFAAISYVCFKIVKKRQVKKLDLIDDSENNGSLLVDEDHEEEGLAPEDM